jgi:hypothetical protein
MLEQSRKKRTLEERLAEYELRLRASLERAEHTRYALSLHDAPAPDQEPVRIRIPERVEA